MKRSTDRILTTHTGSLARPADLIDLLRAKEAGESYDAAALAERVRSSVAEVVQKQTDAGVDVVSDGEESKPGFANYIKDHLTGFVTRERTQSRSFADQADFPDFKPLEASTIGSWRLVCNGPVAPGDGAALQADLANFRAALEGAPVTEAFVPAISPGTLSQNVTNEHYDSDDAFLFAVADAMAHEYKAIVDAGFLLQIDSPDLAMGKNAQFPDASVDEFRAVIDRRIEALNHALAGIPADRVRHHICWGNYEGPHHRDIELRDIVDVLFKANVGAMYIEGASPRHGHDWKVFEDVKLPKDLTLIVGVIDTKTNIIEHPGLVADRIVNYANLIGRENVIAGTDCGFGTAADRTRVAPSISWAKLKAMSDGAALASQELWR
ncbi:MAG: cobalamin-independent methionine synthase II family protein [Chloroflexi bacterium]|nr:cobalamin-independent methionine synthase II family protein [Chloroflexota bacterium]